MNFCFTEHSNQINDLFSITDLQSEVVPGIHMLHSVLCQYRDLSNLRCADQEDSPSLCVPARILQVKKLLSINHCIAATKTLTSMHMHL